MKDRIELAKLFKELGFKVGAEIGVFQGSYSRALCRYNPDLLLYSIDAWIGQKHEKMHERAINKLKGYNAILIKEESSVAVKRFEDNSLDFVYIDADHRYPAVLKDLTLWTPKVRSGGIVSGHDYQAPDVRRAVDEFAKVMTTDCDTVNPRNGITERSWYFINE